MKVPLTNRQMQVLEIIDKTIKSDGRPPSISELQAALGLQSPNGVTKHLNALETKGYIKRKKGARGLTVLGENPELHFDNSSTAMESCNIKQIPVIGTIAAGSPLLADENIENQLFLPDELVGSNDSFLLRIKGESMIEEGILSGDLVVIEKCARVGDGEIAAVLIEDEATLKRFFLRGETAILEPANKNYDAIEVDLKSNSCKILGKLVGLIRSYKSRL